MIGLEPTKKGFCTISPRATTGKGILTEMLPLFLGQICQVEEFDSQGGVLCLNKNNTALGMFDKEDIINSFECVIQGNVILPPNLSMIEQYEYFTRLTMRQGGYNSIVKNMVIVSSLHKGEYHDKFLFAKQNEQDLSNLSK